MATGFRSYRDVAGNPIVTDMTEKLSQMQGYVDTGAVNGSRTIPKPPAGRTQFYSIIELGTDTEKKGHRPGVTLTVGSTSNSLSWEYKYVSGNGAFSMNCRIHYGYF